MEHIRTLEQYAGYLIYDDGRVYSTKTNRFMSQFLDNGGYLRVSLTFNGKYKPVGVHRLVAMAFLDNPNNLYTVNHKDENKLNNNVSNLEWLSNRDNVNYGTAHIRSGASRRKKIIATSLTGETKEFNSVYEAEEQGYGKAKSLLQAIRMGYVSKGFKWRYAV